MKTIRTVIALLSLFISSAAFADSPVLIGKLYYLLDNKKLEAQITNSRDPDVSRYQFSSISIPSEVTYDKKKYKVTSIGTGAFMNSKVESVTVPNTVTDLSSNAFYMCYSLTSVTLPNGIKQIGYNAFSYCSSLKSIIIPEGVVSIGDQAFSHCGKLEAVTFPKSLVFMSTDAFEECKELRSVTVRSGKPFSLYKGSFEVYGDLHVPKGSKSTYENAAIWKNFNIIEDQPEDPSATGIADISVNEKLNTNIFSISGSRISTLKKGVNIVKGKKVVVK